MNSALDGEGARRAGGRWNSPGIPVVYTSSTLSLAILELLVHTDPDLVPDDLQAFEISVPDSLIAGALHVSTLPSNWRAIPNHPSCRALGDAWATGQTHVLLRVPSAVVPEELNYLINPAHRDAGQVRAIGARPFSFDARLL